jgi:PAT family beta-lactamase induction signal transducer AmpG
MAAPFLLQTGFSLTDVGAIQSGVGLIATIGGVLLGGAFMSRIGINKSLWIFGALQAASNFGYFVLAQVGKNYALMVGAILIEHLCAGLTIAALVGFIMSLCNPSFSATQYALLSSLEAAGRNIVTAPVGMLAKSTGWPMFFLITCAAALPGLLLLPAFAPWNNRDHA